MSFLQPLGLRLPLARSRPRQARRRAPDAVRCGTARPMPPRLRGAVLEQPLRTALRPAKKRRRAHRGVWLADTESSQFLTEMLASIDGRLGAMAVNLAAAGRAAEATAKFGNATFNVAADGLRAINDNLVADAKTTAALLQMSDTVLRGIIVVKDLLLRHVAHGLCAAHPNPLARFGEKCFSQNDEDGITLEIVRRLGVEKGRFAEFGVGNGLENNTIILGALGWRGFWVGGEDLAIAVPESGRLHYTKDWITLENIARHASAGLGLLGGGADSLDVISLDLDGNDIYFVENLLENGFRPKLFIVEYQAKFPPPARFQIAYDPDHEWNGDDYFGAALQNYADMFDRHGFRLVCCNSLSGANAFFVRNDFCHMFGDVPADIRDIYVEPRFTHYNNYGHRMSARVVEAVFA
jgi:hypothetical protein